jgi:hypothetical protein
VNTYHSYGWLGRLQRIVLGISLGPKVRNKEFSTEEEEEEPAK